MYIHMNTMGFNGLSIHILLKDIIIYSIRIYHLDLTESMTRISFQGLTIMKDSHIISGSQ
jgi:hypothetical protein